MGLWRDRATKDWCCKLPARVRLAILGMLSRFANVAGVWPSFSADFSHSSVQEWCKFDLEWALFKERWQLDLKPMQDSKLVS